MVRHVTAGPFEGLAKEDLPGQLCAFTAGGAARRGAARAGLLRPRALALLALRPGRLARPGPLGRAARAHDAHHGQGQERAAGRRRRPRAAGPRDRRGAGRRGRRPADRQHRRPRPSSWSTSTTPTRRGSPSSRPASTSTVFRPASRSWTPDAASASPRGRRCVLLFVGRIQPLKAPDVLLRPPPQLLEPATRSCATGSSSPSSAARAAVGLAHPQSAAEARPSRSASPTWCASCRRSRRRSWPTGTAPPTSPSCPRTTSRSAWSPSRRRPAARRSWRRPSAACAPRWRRVSGVLVDGHDPGDYARVIEQLVDQPARRAALSAAAAARHRVRLGCDGPRHDGGVRRGFGDSHSAARRVLTRNNAHVNVGDVVRATLDDLEVPYRGVDARNVRRCTAR